MHPEANRSQLPRERDMAGETERSVLCQICQQPKPRGEVFHGDLIHGPVREAIRKRYPNWSDDHYVCAADLHRFRTEYVEDVLKEEKGELTTLEQQVVALRSQERLYEATGAGGIFA